MDRIKSEFNLGSTVLLFSRRYITVIIMVIAKLKLKQKMNYIIIT